MESNGKQEHIFAKGNEAELYRSGERSDSTS